MNAVSIEFKTAQDSALFLEKALDIKRAWPVVSICIYYSNLTLFKLIFILY
jgi:hypothetical protein